MYQVVQVLKKGGLSWFNCFIPVSCFCPATVLRRSGLKVTDKFMDAFRLQDNVESNQEPECKTCDEL